MFFRISQEQELRPLSIPKTCEALGFNRPSISRYREGGLVRPGRAWNKATISFRMRQQQELHPPSISKAGRSTASARQEATSRKARHGSTAIPRNIGRVRGANITG